MISSVFIVLAITAAIATMVIGSATLGVFMPTTSLDEQNVAGSEMGNPVCAQPFELSFAMLSEHIIDYLPPQEMVCGPNTTSSASVPSACEWYPPAFLEFLFDRAIWRMCFLMLSIPSLV
jgi:hypothetical protein